MAYQAQAVDTTEPISDDCFQIAANAGTYNVIVGADLTFDAGNMTVDNAAGGMIHNGLISHLRAPTAQG